MYLYVVSQIENKVQLMLQFMLKNVIHIYIYFFFFYIPIKFYSKQTKVTRRCHEEHGNT